MYLICWNLIRSIIIRALADREIRLWGQRPHEWDSCLYEEGLTESVHCLNHRGHVKASIHEVDSPIRYHFQFQNHEQSISAVYRFTWSTAFCCNGTGGTSVVLLMGKLRNRDSGWPHYWNVNSKQADPKACFIHCFSYCYFRVHGRNSWREERLIWGGSVRGSVIVWKAQWNTLVHLIAG